MVNPIAPGSLGIDYSYARPPVAQIPKDGAKFVLRYSAGAASNPKHASYGINKGKLITPTEFKALTAAGLDVIANDEWYESRVTEGAKAGAADGAASLALWKSCGLAKGASIYCSWDANPAVAKWPAVDAYLKAFDKALGGYYHVDAYAGSQYLKHALANKIIRYGWRPNAGSWSNDGLPYQPDTSTGPKRAALVSSSLDNTQAHIWQTGNYWYSKSADENLILRSPFGSHLQAQATPPAPPTPPKPPITPAVVGSGYYHGDGHASTAMISPNGDYGAFLLDDGRVQIRKYDPKLKHGTHVRFL